jgi:hypothetical protein
LANINIIKNRKFKVADLFGHSISIDIKKKKSIEKKDMPKSSKSLLEQEVIFMGFLPNQESFNVGLNYHLEKLKKID